MRPIDGFIDCEAGLPGNVLLHAWRSNRLKRENRSVEHVEFRTARCRKCNPFAIRNEFPRTSTTKCASKNSSYPQNFRGTHVEKKLFVAQRFDGAQARRADSRKHAADDSDEHKDERRHQKMDGIDG